MSNSSTGYLGMADLDGYDGGQWTFSASFQPTGGRVPGSAASANLIEHRDVTQQVELSTDLPVPLLPALDRPVSVTGLAVAADPTSGMLTAQARASRLSYSVVSDTASATLAALSPADEIDRSVAPAPDSQIPPDTSSDLATALRFVATLTGTRPAPTVAFLQITLDALHSKEKWVTPMATAPPARPGPRRATTTTAPTGAVGGTSLSQVINAVTVNRSATPEQFATFYVMVARYLGVPARVVTGFRVAGGSAGRPVGPGTYQVTDRQAWTWVEIPVQGLGWVVGDPTPDATTALATAPPEQLTTPVTTVPPRQANAVPRSQIVGGHALAPRAAIRVPVHHPVSAWLLTVIALGGALLLLVALGPGQAAIRRARRRRLRRSQDPTELAVGAWLEMLDGLDRAGMRPVAGATSSEVAEDVGHHFGPELVPQAASVAAVADRAVFSAAGPVPVGMAETAWEDAAQLRRRVAATLDTRQRFWSTLLVGSAPSRPGPNRRARRRRFAGEPPGSRRQ
jgi:hypothetical protein